MPIEIKVKMDVDSMTDFMFYHIYSGSAGMMTLGLGALNVGCTIAFFLRGDYLMMLLFIVFAVLLLGVFPVFIRKKVAKQMENSKRLGVEVDYKFDEEGIETTTSYDSGKAPWDMFKKAASTKKNLIIYDGQKRAVILPVHQMGEQKEAVVELIRKHMPPSAVRDPAGICKEIERKTMVIETYQEKETYELGRRLGAEAKAGQVYTLVGDLGVGKTVFTKGLAAGLGIEEAVSSPTFTIVQVYEEGRLPFYHFDVYRIGDVEEMEEIGYEDYIYGEGVCLIEWAVSDQRDPSGTLYGSKD